MDSTKRLPSTLAVFGWLLVTAFLLGATLTALGIGLHPVPGFALVLAIVFVGYTLRYAVAAQRD
jgi:hypothetical protein